MLKGQRKKRCILLPKCFRVTAIDINLNNEAKLTSSLMAAPADPIREPVMPLGSKNLIATLEAIISAAPKLAMTVWMVDCDLGFPLAERSPVQGCSLLEEYLDLLHLWSVNVSQLSKEYLLVKNSTYKICRRHTGYRGFGSLVEIRYTVDG